MLHLDTIQRAENYKMILDEQQYHEIVEQSDSVVENRAADTYHKSGENPLHLMIEFETNNIEARIEDGSGSVLAAKNTARTSTNEDDNVVERCLTAYIPPKTQWMVKAQTGSIADWYEMQISDAE